MTAINLAAICMNSTNDKKRNIETALRYVRDAAKKGANWILLPEVFAYHGPYDKIYEMAESESGPLNESFSKLARELGVCIFAGTVGERPEEGELNPSEVKNRDGHKRVFNTAYIFDRTGKRVGKYRKTHLFNLYDEKKQPLYCESDGFIPGKQLSTFELDGFKVGMAICYDIRFPGFFSNLVRESSIDILVVPSAFTFKTGQDHWELLLRARAIECQCYVFAANQTGTHSPGKISYGHSMIIDPWGEVLANTGNDEGIAMTTASHEKIAQIRSRLPALENRRPELY